MERLIRNVTILGVLFVGFGAWLNFAPKPVYVKKTEKEMEQLAPDTVGRFTYFRSPENPEQSYRMDDFTYEELDPNGIVARRYEDGFSAYDVVLIASGDYTSFHDPRVCFTGSGWKLSNERVEQVQTQTRGVVPVTVVDLEGAGGRKSNAIYFYRGPTEFTAKTNDLKMNMFMTRLQGGRNVDGVFYRVIPLTENQPISETLKFVGKYLDASKESSGGYF